MSMSVKSVAKTLLGALAAAFTLGLVISIWAVLIEPGRITYREHPVYIKNWPTELSGFTIAFITDTHVGSPHITLEKMRDIVEKTNALNPDLTLLGGDYIIQGVLGGKVVPSWDVVTVLAQLRATQGVFGVLGNHDWWENAPRMQQEFEQAHVPMLEDTARHIKVGTKGFWLVGISDYTEGPHDTAKAFTGITNNDPVIVLTHSPDIFPELPANAALTLAGHTHGGQVYIPFLGRLVVPSKFGPRYAYGLITEGAKQLFVGAGIGTSILPIRFLTPPEVSILKIYPTK